MKQILISILRLFSLFLHQQVQRRCVYVKMSVCCSPMSEDKSKSMKERRRIASQVTFDIIDDFQNRYLSVAEYINYKVILQSRSSHSSLGRSFPSFRSLRNMAEAMRNNKGRVVTKCEEAITKTMHNGCNENKGILMAYLSAIIRKNFIEIILSSTFYGFFSR